MRWLPLSVIILWACSLYSASADNNGVKKMKVQFATGPLLKFQIWHIASFLSMFKLLLIGVIIVGKDPFALFGMQAPGLWVWSQENKARPQTFPIYACMMVFFFSNMIENQCMSTGAFEITLNGNSVVKLSYACEVTFMKVCAESSNSTSAHPMFRVILTVPLGDAPPTDTGVGITATTVAI
ncbi:Thioredoxin reductase-like selenoprotein T1a [Labeo rohita]|uniref:Selenoprotein T n=1 Tax=Labeo rohita TaxID=84645 RepID=A0ABQ8MWW5_LABRO|nr:Thioredoxin reductase-like selenoprotein T1a [Labeo rohita]